MQEADFPEALQPYWKKLNSGFPQVREIFADCMSEALLLLSSEGVEAYIDTASFLGRMGRGAEPILAFLQIWPSVAKCWGEAALAQIMVTLRKMERSPNSKAIAPFLQTLPAVARRLHSQAQMQDYFAILLALMEKTTGSVHGIHTTFASPGLPEFLQKAPYLVSVLAVHGLNNWVQYGIRHYSDHPERQREYFSLQSADSRAVLQRERHGTLLADNERKLDLFLRALWQEDVYLVPFSTGFDEQNAQPPYFDAFGMRLPDVYDTDRGVSGLDRYRAALAHMAAHKRWSTPILPIITVRCNAWPRKRLKIHAWNISPCSFTPDCAEFFWRCIRCRTKTPATRNGNRLCVTVSPWYRVPCWILRTPIAMRKSATLASDFMH